MTNTPISPIRMDLLANPRGVHRRVREAVAAEAMDPRTDDELAAEIRSHIAARVGVSDSWVALAPTIEALTTAIAVAREDRGLLMFPPETVPFDSARVHADALYSVERGNGFRIPIRDGVDHLPKNMTAFVMSPNDPSGLILRPQEVVRLARRSSLLVIDERHAAYSPRSTMPFVREWETIVVVQTSATFAALEDHPLAWAVAPPNVVGMIGEALGDERPSRAGLVGMSAVIDHWGEIELDVRSVQQEKSRLYRQLRKLNMVSVPYPSWANFLLAKFERGGAEFFVPRLADRGIVVHRPDWPNLRDHVRISAIDEASTLALKAALVEIALELD